ncbi:MAG: hypothetical protein ACKVP2_13455 [Burkholderiales bacterium]
MMPGSHLVFGVIAAAFLYGCQTTQAPTGTAKTHSKNLNVALEPASSLFEAPRPPEPVIGDLDRAAMYFGRIRALDATLFAGENMAAQRSFSENPSDLNRLCLAMAMALASGATRDDEKILGILFPMIRSSPNENSPIRFVANLLHSEVVEHRRMGEMLRQNTLKLKEEAKRNDLLQQKLNAILEMEKSLIDREPPATGPRK